MQVYVYLSAYIGCQFGSCSQKDRQVPLSRFPPLIMASRVQPDSSSCLFSLIYQARADKCKHLPRYPPHLGALGGWMCSIFFSSPYGRSMHYSHLAVCPTFSPQSSPLLLSHLIQNTISSSMPVNRCGLRLCQVQQYGIYVAGVVKVYSFSVVWCWGCCVHTRVLRSVSAL